LLREPHQEKEVVKVRLTLPQDHQSHLRALLIDLAHLLLEQGRLPYSVLLVLLDLAHLLLELGLRPY
jgi:hypothetical protein